jgi:hypothetical protein
MNILVNTLVENEDGSADVELELDEEAKILLIGEGFLSIVKEWIELHKNDNKKAERTV